MYVCKLTKENVCLLGSRSLIWTHGVKFLPWVMRLLYTSQLEFYYSVHLVLFAAHKIECCVASEW